MQTAPRQITLESAAKQGITLGKALYFKTNQAFSQTAVIWNWHKQMPSGLAAGMRRAIALAAADAVRHCFQARMAALFKRRGE
jgi:hypothetical protein